MKSIQGKAAELRKSNATDWNRKDEGSKSFLLNSNAEWESCGGERVGYLYVTNLTDINLG